MGRPLLPAAPSLSAFRYQRWEERTGLCRQRQRAGKRGLPGFWCFRRNLSRLGQAPRHFVTWLRSVSPRNSGCRAGGLSKGTFSEAPSWAKRYDPQPGFGDATLCSQNLPESQGQRAVPRGSTRPCAAGNAQGSSSLELLHRAGQLTSDGDNGKTRGQEGHRSTNSGCSGLWVWGRAGRACGHGCFSMVLLESVILRWVRRERVAVSVLSALISMVTRGT